jgi:hypothetical protein
VSDPPATARIRGLEEALRIIAANSCCQPCREAGLVALAALATAGKPDTAEGFTQRYGLTNHLGSAAQLAATHAAIRALPRYRISGRYGGELIKREHPSGDWVEADALARLLGDEKAP